jgi:hypothetical protein
MSFGGAMASPAEAAHTLAARADVALYRSKRLGRNQVQFDGVVPEGTAGPGSSPGARVAGGTSSTACAPA